MDFVLPNVERNVRGWKGETSSLRYGQSLRKYGAPLYGLVNILFICKYYKDNIILLCDDKNKLNSTYSILVSRRQLLASKLTFHFYVF